MPSKIKVVDVFAGPGGLGEGFARFEASGHHRPFEIVVSAEMDPSARQTLRLRSFYRLCEQAGGVPDSYYEYVSGERESPWTSETEDLWEYADRSEALRLTLGRKRDNTVLQTRIKESIAPTEKWLLIGGPPCQAYSLVGRSRNKGKEGYDASKDKRHFLYKQYLELLQLNGGPDVFIMENVRGLLSSSVGAERIFPKILEDLSWPGKATKSGPKYVIYSLAADTEFSYGQDPQEIDAASFILKAEEFGVPQARHRVILVGVNENKCENRPALLRRSTFSEPLCVKSALSGLPALRSGVTGVADTNEDWSSSLRSAIASARTNGLSNQVSHELNKKISSYVKSSGNRTFPHGRGGLIVPHEIKKTDLANIPRTLREWIFNPKLKVVLNHQARRHMQSDLARYLFCAAFTRLHSQRSPNSRDFPKSLAPAHKNWNSGNFADRFRTQAAGKPATTVTSHIAKDGHYFIHPDPTQCRSLTVREAARLQTFPDDYYFMGTRTSQYTQVGNAVPPFLALKIANVVADILK